MEMEIKKMPIDYIRPTIKIKPINNIIIDDNNYTFVKTSKTFNMRKKDGIIKEMHPVKYLCNNIDKLILRICFEENCLNICKTNHNKCYKCMNIYRNKKCDYLSCKKQPCYNFEGLKPIKCCEHKLEGMIDVKNKKCDSLNCEKQPNYNFEGLKAIKCYEHKEEGMIDVKHFKCSYTGCNTRPCYNFVGLKPTKCVSHKLEGMINVIDRVCDNPSCSVKPSYNFEGLQPIKCIKHKEKGMINTKHNKCDHINCYTRPCHNFEGLKPIKCVAHKLEGMINVVDRKCDYPGCYIMPCCNFDGLKPTKCTKHKDEGMIDVKSKKCNHPGCYIIPCYNVIGLKPLKCFKHREEGMVDVKHTKCSNPNCHKRPSYNFKGLQPVKCSEHKEESMVNISIKKCINIDCNTAACFGKLFESKIHCASHKNNNEYIKNKPKCIFMGCDKYAYYTNSNNGYPKRCDIHKLIDDNNIIERSCSKCGLLYFIPSDRTECNECYEFFIKKIHKIKENDIKQLLVTNNIKYESYDSTIPDSCSRRRPDFIFDRGTYKLILEVDEGQHSIGYLPECEEIRMKQIFHDFGGYYVHFIRYNPDEYIDKNGKKIYKKKEREEILLKHIWSFDDKQTLENPLSVSYLFYNGWGTSIQNKILLEKEH